MDAQPELLLFYCTNSPFVWGDTDGFFSIKAQSITIRAGMRDVQTVCAAVHEIAHAKLHDYEHMTELADDGETILVPGEKSRNTEEVEAESIS